MVPEGSLRPHHGGEQGVPERELQVHARGAGRTVLTVTGSGANVEREDR